VRLAARQAEAAPLVTALKSWFEAQSARVAAAFRYGLNHWDGLARYLDDRRIEIDTNAVERGMRPLRGRAAGSQLSHAVGRSRHADPKHHGDRHRPRALLLPGGSATVLQQKALDLLGLDRTQ
jgi:hypothetical protein